MFFFISEKPNRRSVVVEDLPVSAQDEELSAEEAQMVWMFSVFFFTERSTGICELK